MKDLDYSEKLINYHFIEINDKNTINYLDHLKDLEKACYWMNDFIERTILLNDRFARKQTK